LGFTHALNRKLSETHDLGLTGCAVISNQAHNKVYQPKKYADFEFLQSKNPPVLVKHKSSSPPIIEEGKMNLTVSLVIELGQTLLLTSEQQKQFEAEIYDSCSQMRLAGGTILSIQQVKLVSASTEKEQQQILKKVKRLVMPGFVLLDKSHYLQEHYQSIKQQDEYAQLFDAWLDFSALKYKSIAKPKDEQGQPDETTPADWQYQPKPNKGYLVPLMTGYKAISDLYEAGEVANARDSETPTRFVEAIHSVGEWKGAHSIHNLSDVIWRYHHQLDSCWYLCTQTPNQIIEKQHDVVAMLPEQTQSNLTDVLDLL
jgi:CRISPR-associated protein Csy2